MNRLINDSLKEITTEELLILICERAQENFGEDTLSLLRQNFVIEETDLINYKKPIERASAARILHMYLKAVIKEADNSDISAAEHDLTDLYDCRVCANHIAQVYVKGIMPEEYSIDFIGKKAFGLHSTLSMEEAKLFADRLFNNRRRSV